jgi:hypothetical protein
MDDEVDEEEGRSEHTLCTLKAEMLIALDLVMLPCNSTELTNAMAVLRQMLACSSRPASSSACWIVL